MKFRIYCEVSGGNTGYRCGYLKKNGEVLIFDSKDAADIEANRITARMNTPYATATYRYTVEDFLSGDELLATHRYKGQSALDLN